jgi:hypothetical protein
VGRGLVPRREADVSETASHTAVYVASQFLSDPAVRKFVESAKSEEAPR